MNYKISIEGQTIDMPEEIAGEDAKLKAALTPFFPGAANAKFMRSEPKDGLVTVTIIKQAGTKGAGTGTKGLNADLIIIDDPIIREPQDQVLRRLIEAEEGINPVVDLHRALEGKLLNQMGVEKLMALDKKIDLTIQEGRKERDDVETTLSLLEHARPQPAESVSTGF